jgi:hypothetical protein
VGSPAASTLNRSKMSKRAIQTNEKVCLPRCVLKRIKRPKRPERKECPIGGLQTPNEQAVNAYIAAASRGIRTEGAMPHGGFH